jgi:aspartate/methionine/tyrosine aminotransferase
MHSILALFVFYGGFTFGNDRKGSMPVVAWNFVSERTAASLHPVLPEGTFYAFARFPQALGDSREVAQRLLQEHSVVVTPGSAYGPSSKHYLRLSFATSEDTIREGARRIGKFFSENS